MQKFVLLFSLLLFTFVLSAQNSSPLGLWKTIDDETKEAKSHMELYEKNGKVYGKITKLLLKPADTVCEKCKGEKANKPLIGMILIDGLVKSGEQWKGASILDPVTGNYYDCTIWLSESNENELKVKGKHWTGLSRTQTWYRIKS
ncbi:MAG: DUF2147 domain-containing protein [Bacteroidetes bacterium]|nr:DUF2147 domain-containing protein [Bacteroidota bacterium]